MEKTELWQCIAKVSKLSGSFLLRSGETSNTYFDKYQFESDPVLLRALAQNMAPLIPPKTQVLAGLEMGGIAISTALSLQTGIPQVMVRKEAKNYGTARQVEGIDISGKYALIVEDIITTGGQAALSAPVLRGLGANVENVLAVLERGSKGRENLAALGLELIALFDYGAGNHHP